jgi:hypothetical protein
MVAVRRSYVDGPFGQMHIRVAGEQSDHPPLFCFHMSPMSGRIFAKFIAERRATRSARHCRSAGPCQRRTVPGRGASCDPQQGHDTRQAA